MEKEILYSVSKIIDKRGKSHEAIFQLVFSPIHDTKSIDLYLTLNHNFAYNKEYLKIVTGVFTLEQVMNIINTYDIKRKNKSSFNNCNDTKKAELNENNLITFKDFYQFHKELFWKENKLIIPDKAIQKFIDWSARNHAIDVLKEKIQEIDYSSDSIHFDDKNKVYVLKYNHEEEIRPLNKKEAYQYLLAGLVELLKSF